MVKIAYLGWGSLLWNPENLPVNTFKLTNLTLPLEFSRISDQGKGRLTLVIDEKHGTPVNVWYGLSTEKNANRAINALKKREKTILQNIAYINLKSGKSRYNNTPKEVVEEIEEWAKENKMDVVIWTDLPSNWRKLKKSEYSKEKAYKYFLDSPFQVQLKILEYIYKANRLGKIKTKFSEYFLSRLARL